MIPGKDPAKTVAKEYRRLGATQEKTRNGTSFRFPDDARLFVPANVRWGPAHDMIRAAQARYGGPERPALSGERVKLSEAPTVDLTRVVVTPHAIQRRREMRNQDDLTTLEVATALTCPVRVLWMPKHGTYAWVGDRVAVVGHSRDGVLTIRTFLWTTNELWAKNPRPEKELIGQ